MESDIQRDSKHTREKTALNGSYLFKLPCILVALVAAGFAGKLNGRKFSWNRHYIPGRQLMTAARIQQLWPGKWEHFCNQLLPGFRQLQHDVLNRGHRNLDDHEKDSQAQAQLLAYLLIVLLRDSAILLYQQPNARIWRDLCIFRDPASEFMIWHATRLQPAVLQLQQQAEKIHYSVISHNGSKTIMDEALELMNLTQAQTAEQAWDLHAKMAELVSRTTVPAAAVSQQPAVPVEAKPLGLYLSNTEGDSLHLLWSAWDTRFRQHFGPGVDVHAARPQWAPGMKSGDKLKDRKQLLLELDRQIQAALPNLHCKAAEKRPLAVKHVLSTFQTRMDTFACVSAGGQKKGISLAQVAAGFKSVGSNKSSNVVLLQRGTTANPGSKIEVSRSGFMSHFGA